MFYVFAQLAEFGEFAKVFPLRVMGFTPEPSRYLVSVGLVELSLGLALLLGATPTKRVACKGLMVIMAGATQTLVAKGQYMQAPIPAAFFLGLFALHQNLSVEKRAKRS